MTEDVEVCFQVVVTVSVIGTKPVVGKKFCGGIVKRGCQSIGSGYAASSVGTPTGSAVPAVTSSGSIDCEGRNIWKRKNVRLLRKQIIHHDYIPDIPGIGILLQAVGGYQYGHYCTFGV